MIVRKLIGVEMRSAQEVLARDEHSKLLCAKLPVRWIPPSITL